MAALAKSLGCLVWLLPETQRKTSKRGIIVMVFDVRLEIHSDEASASMLAAR